MQETKQIPYRKETVTDASLEKGKRLLRTKGVTGTERLVYQVTLTDGVPTSRKLLRRTVVTAPVSQVTAIGTKVKPKPQPQPASACDPNYSGACVPIASDVDCAGGSGNGPAYVRGPVRVIGTDVYGLDRDGDGTGCDT
jgi:resuscitation-promoting factor RpfB